MPVQRGGGGREGQTNLSAQGIWLTREPNDPKRTIKQNILKCCLSFPGLRNIELTFYRTEIVALPFLQLCKTISKRMMY